MLWDHAAKSQKPVLILNKHKSAVKAIDWCPWRSNILATGGGNRDCTLKIWNIYNGVLLKNYDLKSQITGILWSDKDKEILTSSGKNHGLLTVFKFPTMFQVGSIKVHDERILNMNTSANGEIVVSLSADQSLKFWDLFKIETEKNYFLTSPISTRHIKQSEMIR